MPRYVTFATLLGLALTTSACTAVDQSFGLSEADTTFAANTLTATKVAETIPEPATALPAAEGASEGQGQTAGIPTPALPQSDDAAGPQAPKLPVPGAVISTTNTNTNADAPVLALRPRTEQPEAFRLVQSEAKRAKQAKTTRSRGLEGSFAKLATAAPGVRNAAPTREKRRRIIIKPSETAPALPGVRPKSSIFGIKRGKNEDGAIRVASAAGLGRSMGSIVRQTPSVSIECFKPGLVDALRRVERKFGQKVVVTSGYRSPKRNRRAGGAKGSKHMTCEAADIQVPGVSKAKLAAFLRSMPNRGGVGTYCHTKSVHYDIGSKRDWSWGCRRR